MTTANTHVRTINTHRIALAFAEEFDRTDGSNRGMRLLVSLDLRRDRQVTPQEIVDAFRAMAKKIFPDLQEELRMIERIPEVLEDGGSAAQALFGLFEPERQPRHWKRCRVCDRGVVVAATLFLRALNGDDISELDDGEFPDAHADDEHGVLGTVRMVLDVLRETVEEAAAARRSALFQRYAQVWGVLMASPDYLRIAQQWLEEVSPSNRKEWLNQVILGLHELGEKRPSTSEFMLFLDRIRRSLERHPSRPKRRQSHSERT